MGGGKWPEDDDGRPPPGRSAHAEPAVTQPLSTSARIRTEGHIDSNCVPRQCRRNIVGRHADAWREGFAYGFRDALRLAQREIHDPAVWLALSRLADRYDHLEDAATGGDTR